MDKPMICGRCGFKWDDSVITDRTPVPGPRTPCEYYHVLTEGGTFIGRDFAAIEKDADFIKTVNGNFPEETERIRFFYENAGFSYRPDEETKEQGRERCARDLARAEVVGRRNNWWTTVDVDPEGPMEDDAGSVEGCACGEYVCLMVTLWRDSRGQGLMRDDEIIGSLSNIIVSAETGENDPYIRVVGAELASEAIRERGGKP